MPIAKNVMRILKGWGRMAIGDFRAFAQSVCTKMSENSELFPKPPVVLAVLQSDLDRLVSFIGEASYNDSRRIIQRDTLRNEIHVMLRQLAHYVEDLCDAETDRTTQNYLVAHSGFKAMSNTVSPAEFLLSQIKGIDNPRKGVLHVRYTAAGRDARQYQIRMAGTDTPDPDSWPISTFPNAKDGATFENLTPGVSYTFQVRVMSRLGVGDWSYTSRKMCT
jgi:hypothetical protein